MKPLPYLQLKKAIHREQAILLIQFEHNQTLNNIVRGLPGVLWSKTFGCWYVGHDAKNLGIVIDRFKGEAQIDYDSTEITRETVHERVGESVETNKAIIAPVNPQGKTPLKPLDPNHFQDINRLKQWMQSRRYSLKTIENYINSLEIFLRFYPYKKLNEITNEDVIRYNNEYILFHQYSASYQSQTVNVIKLFYKIVYNSVLDLSKVHRPKKAKQLPNVLSTEEVKRILEISTNIKHRTMLSVIYSCGLRCGELLTLKPEHVDSKRNLLIIKGGKGNKDRISPLSDKTINLLREYYKVYKPKVYLFEGAIVGEPYDVRSLQNVLKQCVTKAGIEKPVTLHWLRHSYATHLLELGTDLRYIQEILGHKSSKTTEIYTHVSTKSIQKIISPFDRL